MAYAASSVSACRTGNRAGTTRQCTFAPMPCHAVHPMHAARNGSAVMCVGPKKENSQPVLAGHLGRPLDARGDDGDAAKYLGRRLTFFRPGLCHDVLIGNIGCLPRISLLPSHPCFESHSPRARWTRSLSHVGTSPRYVFFGENMASTGGKHAGVEIRRQHVDQHVYCVASPDHHQANWAGWALGSRNYPPTLVCQKRPRGLSLCPPDETKVTTHPRPRRVDSA